MKEYGPEEVYSLEDHLQSILQDPGQTWINIHWGNCESWNTGTWNGSNVVSHRKSHRNDAGSLTQSHDQW